MNLLPILLCILCLWLGRLYVRLCGDIRSLEKQLEQIKSGSHMELNINSRQKCLLALCIQLNQVLSAKDAEHIRYEKYQRQLKQNIANLAHDIRTPLTGASGYLQLGKETMFPSFDCSDPASSPQKAARYLQAAENRLTELEDMLEKLFLYTKLTGEDFSLTPENLKKIQVLPLLSDCLLSLYARFEQAGTSPQISFDTADFCVMAEEEALRRVFLNLIQNALLHGTGDLAIIQPHAPASCLIFENSLPQNSAVDTTQIFDRFYKADPARGKSSSGLGLFIVKEFMHRMGGDAEARLKDRRLQILLFFHVP